MKPQQLPLYPKSSSIYNKILQLAIAVLLLVLVMNEWLNSRTLQQDKIQHYGDYVAKLYLAQAAGNLSSDQKPKLQQLQKYVDTLAKQPLVSSVHIYEKTGRVIVRSENGESINDLFGISPGIRHNSSNLTPYVQELGDDKVAGYIRMSFYRDRMVSQLMKDNQHLYRNLVLLMLISGVIGFLLTRGVNRFSRQGYRPPKNKNLSNRIS